jgi:hypothetical protein
MLGLILHIDLCTPRLVHCHLSLSHIPLLCFFVVGLQYLRPYIIQCSLSCILECEIYCVQLELVCL